MHACALHTDDNHRSETVHADDINCKLHGNSHFTQRPMVKARWSAIELETIKHKINHKKAHINSYF